MKTGHFAWTFQRWRGVVILCAAMAFGVSDLWSFIEAGDPRSIAATSSETGGLGERHADVVP